MLSWVKSRKILKSKILFKNITNKITKNKRFKQ